MQSFCQSGFRGASITSDGHQQGLANLEVQLSLHLARLTESSLFERSNPLVEAGLRPIKPTIEALDVA
jgi:hypothetical protein